MSGILGKKIGHFMLSYFLRIKLDTLVNIHTNFYRKRMRITIKILSYKNEKFNNGHPLIFTMDSKRQYQCVSVASKANR